MTDDSCDRACASYGSCVYASGCRREGRKGAKKPPAPGEKIISGLRQAVDHTFDRGKGKEHHIYVTPEERDPYDLIAEGLWRLHVPEGRNWTWGYDVSRHYAEKYREAARAMVPNPIILP